MAWINQQGKAELAPAIKAVLNKYGLKGTLSIRHHSTLVLTIRSGKLDLVGGYNKWRKANYPDRHYRDETYLQNGGYTRNDEPYYEMYQELVKTMKGTKWYDRSDIMTDYFDTAYYIDINVGEWKKPYILEA